MEDPRTLELIPIDIIEGIIMDDAQYRSFMQRTGNFQDINATAYVQAINDYMSYAIINTNSMSESDFNRVNYINIAFDIDTIYDYQEYLAKTNSLIPMDILFKILDDEDTFNRFMDYENNRDIFGDHDINLYLSNLTKFVDYYSDRGLVISNLQNDRLKSVMKKYSLQLRRTVHLEGYKTPVEADIDAELFKHVIDKIDVTREPFYVARAVYIELAKLVTYDPTFLAFNQDVTVKEASDIYYKNITDISLKDNKIVCRDWAELYAFILNLLGIRAVVSGEFHKYVTFDCDGTLIKADATNTVFALDDFVSMPDIARIQAGLSTGGYVCLENDKDITSLLDEVDKEIAYKTGSIEEKYNELESRYLSIKKTEETYEERVFDAIEFLRKVSLESKLSNFELFKYINALAHPLFKNNKIYGVDTKFICVSEDEATYYAATLVSFADTSGNYRYIIFTKGNLEEVSREELINRVSIGQIKLLGKRPNILGIDKECLNGFTK